MADISRSFGQAVVARLHAQLPPGTPVYYGQVTTPDDQLVYPLAVVWVIPADRVRANLTGTIAAADARVQVTAAGLHPDEVTTLLDRVGAALHGWRPTLPGWRCGLVWNMPVQQPVTKNEDLWWRGRPTYRGVSLYRLAAEPEPDAGS